MSAWCDGASLGMKGEGGKMKNKMKLAGNF